MHDINYTHHHELDEHDFLGCCRDCRASLNIIKPHIMAFADRIHKYSEDMLAELAPDALYRLYQLLDDLAHMDAGDHLAALILDEPDIKQVLPLIRSYYAAFFTIHEKHLKEKCELVMVGSDAVPKEEIFSHLSHVLSPGTKLSYRIYEKGLRRLFDQNPVENLPGQWVEYDRIRPEPPVNNTCVFLIKEDRDTR